MSQFHNIDTRTLRDWRETSKSLMDHPRMPETTVRPDLPGRDWYRENFAELDAEIKRREEAEK